MSKLSTNISFVISALLFAVSAIAQPEASVLLPGNAANYNINTTDINSIHTRTKLFQFSNHLVSDVAYIVQNSLSIYGTLSIDEPNNLLIITDEANKLDDVMHLCTEVENNVSALFKRIDTKQVFVKHNRASELVSYLEPRLSVDGFLKANDDFNFIVINDHPNKLKEIEALIAEFDVPQKQILIDVEIIELSSQGLLDAGINWDELMRGGWMSASANITKLPNNENSKRKLAYSGNIGLQLPEFRKLIRIMQGEGNARIVSTPQIVTRNNQEGSIWYGRDIRIPSGFRSPGQSLSTNMDVYSNQADDRLDVRTNSRASSSSGSYNSSSYARQSQAVSGLSLAITPTIGDSKLVKLDIHCELSDIVNWTDEGLPIVSGQELVSQLIVAQDQTYFLGGLNKQVKVKQKRKVPLLGTILPFMFSREVEQLQEVKLAILLTPHIITADELAETAESYKTNSEQ